MGAAGTTGLPEVFVSSVPHTLCALLCWHIFDCLGPSLRAHSCTPSLRRYSQQFDVQSSHHAHAKRVSCRTPLFIDLIASDACLYLTASSPLDTLFVLFIMFTSLTHSHNFHSVFRTITYYSASDCRTQEDEAIDPSILFFSTGWSASGAQGATAARCNLRGSSAPCPGRDSACRTC
jgi:hypothetical protein